MDVDFFIFKINNNFLNYYYVIWTRLRTPVVTKKQFTIFGQNFNIGTKNILNYVDFDRVRTKYGKLS